MKSKLLLGVLVALSFAVGWSGSSLWHPSSASASFADETATVDSILGSRNGTSPSAPVPYVERSLALAYAPSVLPGEFQARLLELRQLPRNYHRRDAFSQLFEDWVPHDAKAAWDHCQSLEKGAFKNSALLWLVIVWSIHDPDAALEAVLSVPEPRAERDSLLREVALQFGKQSPRRALDLVAQEDLRLSRSFSKLYETVAREDLAEAITRLEGSSSGAAWTGVLQVWLEEDPEAAFAKFATQSDVKPWDMREILRPLLPLVVSKDPRENWKHLSSSLPRNISRQLSDSFAQAWFEEDPEAANAWVAEQEDDVFRDSMTAAISVQLSNSDPPAAFEYLMERDMQARLSHAAYQWGKKDWVAAYTHVSDLQENPEAQAEAASGLLSSLSASMTTEHIHELLTLTEAHNKQANVRELLPRLDPREIPGLLERYPASLAGPMEDFIENLVQRDPEAAIEITSRLPEGEAKSLYSMVVNWTGNDPAGAGAWLETLSEGETRNYAYQNYMNTLTRPHPEAARAWIDSVPAELQETAIEQYVNIMAPTAPEAALSEALKINNPQLIATAMEHWHRLDPQPARKRLAEFDEDLQKAIEPRFDLNDQWRALGEQTESQ